MLRSRSRILVGLCFYLSFTMAEALNNSLPTGSRPAPVFNLDARSFSTKKERRTPRLLPPPKPAVKSCSITRIFRHRQIEKQLPLPVSFNPDGDNSFIVQSAVYQAQQEESYFEQCYEVKEKLGVGYFGEVFRVQSREDGRVYACKKTLFKFRGDADRRRKMAEVAKHEQLPSHRNCVQFFRAWEERQYLYILTEACQQSLAALADDKIDRLPEAMLWNYALDLLQALDHLHQHSLVHMDIKPENIFLSTDGVCKLGDFGLMFDMSKDNMSEVIEGDPKYMAPECLSSTFGPSADLFSLGISLLELALDLDVPTRGPMWQALRSGHLPEDTRALSPALQQLLSGLLEPNPQKRLTASQALALPRIARLARRRRMLQSVIDGANAVSEAVRWLASSALQCLTPVGRAVRALLRRLLLLLWQSRRRRSTTPTRTPRPRDGGWGWRQSRSFPAGEQSLAEPLLSQSFGTSPDLVPHHTSDAAAEHLDSTPLNPSTFRRKGPLQHSDPFLLDGLPEAPSFGRALPKFGGAVQQQLPCSSTPFFSRPQATNVARTLTPHPPSTGDSFLGGRGSALARPPSSRRGSHGAGVVDDDRPSRDLPNGHTLWGRDNVHNSFRSEPKNGLLQPLGYRPDQVGESPLHAFSSSAVHNDSHQSIRPHLNQSRSGNQSTLIIPPTPQSSRCTNLMSRVPSCPTPSSVVQPRRLFSLTKKEEDERHVAAASSRAVGRSPGCATDLPVRGRSLLSLRRQQADSDEEEMERLDKCTSRNLMDLFNSVDCSDSD